MGYNTEFNGAIDINPPITEEHRQQFIDEYTNERHEQHKCGYWCHWTIDGDCIMWDGGEKFYDYDCWLISIINDFFVPRGYELNGSIEWYGDDRDDIGLLDVEANVVTTKNGRVIFDE